MQTFICIGDEYLQVSKIQKISPWIYPSISAQCYPKVEIEIDGLEKFSIVVGPKQNKAENANQYARDYLYEKFGNFIK